jgi:hypothetical protein
LPISTNESESPQVDDTTQYMHMEEKNKKKFTFIPRARNEQKIIKLKELKNYSRTVNKPINSNMNEKEYKSKKIAISKQPLIKKEKEKKYLTEKKKQQIKTTCNLMTSTGRKSKKLATKTHFTKGKD